MSVIAAITTSIDGYITGPDDHDGQGLGLGGERLHNWVMGGPWTYETDHTPGEGMHPVDQEYMEAITANLGASICGRGMFEASGRWGGTNPFDGPAFILTHDLDDVLPPSTGFTFVDDLDRALALAREAAGGKDVAISGGASVIRQYVAAGHVDELLLSTAPIVLGAGKRMWDGFDQDLDLDIVRTWSSPFATHIRYRIRR